VEAKISDPAGIERVELWVDGKMVGVQSPALKGQTAMTALFSWTPLSPGSHTVGIRAINVFGLENDLVVVVVNASGAEPRVTILSPMDGEQLPVGLQIMIQALAEDPTGVERGELWVNGKLVAEWTRTEAESRDSIKAGFFFGSESKSGQTNPPESMAPIKAGFIQLPQVAMSFPWTPSAAGEYTLEVRTFNSSTEQHRATDSVVVVAEGAEATPSMMSITGGAFAPWWMPGLLLLVLLVAFRIIQSRNL
jgi:predicted phage tail protein